MSDEKTKIDIFQVVKKLIGPVDPVGATHIDKDRFENLKKITKLVDQLICEIDYVSTHNKDRQEFSMKQAGQYAYNFLKNDLGIKE